MLPSDSHATRTFRIDSCLGRGGFGEVYLVRMSLPDDLGAMVALKVLRRDVPPANQAVGRLRDEARLLSGLAHPHILRVHDLTVLDERVALISEYIEGQDLNRCIRAEDPINPKAVLQVASDVADALDAAFHRQNVTTGGPLRIVHRDVKPSNIRISTTGGVTLLDFGIARTEKIIREAQTSSNAMVGSPSYMAPERLRGSPAAPFADVFSLGVVLWEGIVGRRLMALPLHELAAVAADAERFDAFVQPRLAHLATLVPADVVALVEAMVSHDSSRRPSAAEVRRRCAQLAEELPGQSLRAWARNRAWPGAPKVDGELVGREFSEQIPRKRITKPFVRRLPATTEVPAHNRIPVWVPVGLGGLALVGLMTVGIGLVLALVPSDGSEEIPAASAEEPDLTVAPATSPPKRERVAPSPTVDVPWPVAPAAQGASVSGAAPHPRAAPVVRVISPPPSFVRNVGNVGATLTLGKTRVRLEVAERVRLPAGTWRVRGHWGGVVSDEGANLVLDIHPGEELALRCTQLMETCATVPP